MSYERIPAEEAIGKVQRERDKLRAEVEALKAQRDAAENRLDRLEDLMRLGVVGVLSERRNPNARLATALLALQEVLPYAEMHYGILYREGASRASEVRKCIDAARALLGGQQ